MRFQSHGDRVKNHHAILESDDFQHAEDMAVLHYQRILALGLGKSANPQVDGMVVAWKLAGVQEFLAEFRNLAEAPIKAETPGLSRTLNHNS